MLYPKELMLVLVNLTSYFKFMFTDGLVLFLKLSFIVLEPRSGVLVS